MPERVMSSYMPERVIHPVAVKPLQGTCAAMQPRSRDRWRNALVKPIAAVSFTGNLWQQGETIRVSFEDRLSTDTDRELIEKCKRHIEYCHSLVGLDLQFVEAGSGDVRISFTRGGSWSYIGTDCKLIPKGEHTMQFGWLAPDSSEDEVQRVVRHEYGIHAFGLGHEQKSPNARIPWHKQAVYDDYARQGWSKEDVDHNVFGNYDASEVGFTEYDPTSLSQYPVKCRHVSVPCEGEYYIGWNWDFSETDIEHLQSLYPKPDDPCDRLHERDGILTGRINALRRRRYRVRKAMKKRGC